MIWWLIHNTLSAALLALVAVLVCRWRRAQPALRHAIWLVVLMKLVAPPMPVWSFAWPGQLPTWWPLTTSASVSNDKEDVVAAKKIPSVDAAEAPADSRNAVSELDLPGNPETYEVLGVGKFERQPESAAKPIHYVEPSPAATEWPLAAWMKSLTWQDVERATLLAWVIGGIGMAAIQLFRWGRFRRLLAATQFAPDWLEDEVHTIARQLDISSPQVRVLELRCTPLVWVLGRTTLLWPAAMLADFSSESRRTILTHELAHLARRDHWVARGEAVATVFWWWHPLFWYVRTMLHDAAEQACDARVTQLLPGERRAYAQALIEVCELLAQAVTPGPALGVGSPTRRAFERRLTMIMREKVASRLSLGAVASVAMLALVVLPGFTPAQVAPAGLTPAAAPPAPESDNPFAAAPPATPVASDPFAQAPGLPAPTPAPSAPVAPPAPEAPTAQQIPGTPPASAPLAIPVNAFPPTGLPSANQPPATPPIPAHPPVAPMAGWEGLVPAKPVAGMGPPSLDWNTGNDGGAEEVVHLTRATYRLPHALAESFSQYLNAVLGDAVQAKVLAPQQANGQPGMPMEDAKGLSRLVITADNETQRTVGHFIGLLRAHGSVPGAMTGMGMDVNATATYIPGPSENLPVLFDEPSTTPPSADPSIPGGGYGLPAQ